MTWWAIDVRTAPEERQRLGAWLVAPTGQAVEERDDGTLVTFAPDDASGRPADRRAGARDEARRRDQPPPDRDRWTGPRAGARLGPRRVGRPHGGAVLGGEPEAPMTRRSCSIPRPPSAAASTAPRGWPHAAGASWSPGDRVLDLGSGSGILAIAAVKLGAAPRDRHREGCRGEPGGLRGTPSGTEWRGRMEFLHGDAADLAPWLGRPTCRSRTSCAP